MNCPHGFPKPSNCVECMYDEGLGPAPTPPVTVEAVFSARFDGHCPECDLPISVGQTVAKLSTDRYVHKTCVT